MSKKIEYATNKWEKRKDSILDHEMARFKKIEELLDYQEKEKKEKLRCMYSLCLAYRQVLEVLFIRKNAEGFIEKLNKMLDLYCECLEESNKMEEPNNTKKSIFSARNGGVFGYFALISERSQLVRIVAEEGHELNRLLAGQSFEIQNDEMQYVHEMMMAVANRDCISFNEALNNRIVSIRKFKLDYYICVDFWSLGLIRYAEQCGMTVDRNKYIEADLDYIGL